MPGRHESRDQHKSMWLAEEFPEPDHGYQEPESPGTKKLRHLASTQPIFEEAEIVTKLMQRPLSSGIKDHQDYAYGAAPKRDLQIPRKAKTTLYAAPNIELSASREIGDARPEIAVVDHVAPGDQRRFTFSYKIRRSSIVDFVYLARRIQQPVMTDLVQLVRVLCSPWMVILRVQRRLRRPTT